MEGHKGGQERRTVRFRVAVEGAPKDVPELTAYLFDARGELLDSALVDKAGSVNLRLMPAHASHARLMVAPTPPKGRDAKPTLASLERLGAYEPVWRRLPLKGEIELAPIPGDLIIKWRWCICRVRGRVVKPVTIGGVTVERPVCHARVHICEVDRWRWWILQLPEDILWRIRDELRQWVDGPWPPIPLPDPGPEFKFDPRVIDVTPQALAQMNKRMKEVRALSMRAPAAMGHEHKAGGCSCGGGAKAVKATEGAAVSGIARSEAVRASAMPQALQSAVIAGSSDILRRALIDHAELVRPFLCWWPWIWPYWYRCDEVAVVETDAQGRFDASVWYLCNGDKPDLYFWVEYQIGGVWTTVYHPWIPCATYWDYPCGSEVTIRVTDPRVPWCGGDDQLPGKQVAVVLVGNNESLNNIQLAAAGTAEGLTGAGAPFGGSLEPHVWFGEGLIPSGVTHYRWSYRRLGSSGDFTPMDKDVVRHYGEESADGTLVFKPFPLGPDPAFVGQVLFKIRPVDPPLNPGAVSSSWAPEINGRLNTASAFFESHTLESGDADMAQGKYELKLELFHADGSVVDWTAEGIAAKQPTIPGPFGPGDVPTAVPPDERLFKNGAGHIVGFRLVLHVDNGVCTAEILDLAPKPGTSGLVIDGICGFIEYAAGASALVSFHAEHPRRFATFTFNTHRGSGIAVPSASATGRVGDTPVNVFGFDAATFVYSKTIDVATLLTENTPAGETPCTRAAFAETLHVYAMATDGWSVLTYLDDDATPKAYALEPTA